MMVGKTKTDRKLLRALEQAGGQVSSKFQLIVDADVNYRKASDRLRLLERKGFIQIKLARPGQSQPVTLLTSAVQPKPQGG